MFIAALSYNRSPDILLHVWASAWVSLNSILRVYVPYPLYLPFFRASPRETWGQAIRNSSIGFLSTSDAAQELLRSSLNRAARLDDRRLHPVTSRCEILLRRLSL